MSLEVPWRSQAVNQVWRPLVVGLGPLSKMFGVSRVQMLFVWEILEKLSTSQDKPFIEKTLETAWLDLKVWWIKVSGNQHVRANSLNQVYRVSDMHLPASSVEEGLKKAQWPLPELLSGRKLPLQLSSWCQTMKFFSLCSWCLLNCCLSTGTQGNWVQVSPYMGPLRGMPESPAAQHLTQPQTLLCFCLIDFREK